MSKESHIHVLNPAVWAPDALYWSFLLLPYRALVKLWKLFNDKAGSSIIAVIILTALVLILSGIIAGMILMSQANMNDLHNTAMLAMRAP